MTAPSAERAQDIPEIEPETWTRMVDGSAAAIVQAFHAYTLEQRALARQAQTWFERCRWKEMQSGARRRLELYAKAVAQADADVKSFMGTYLPLRALWAATKKEYAILVADRADEEIAETFFNSVYRSLRPAVGVDPEVEFVWFDIELMPSGDELPTYHAFHRLHDTRQVVEELLERYAMRVPYVDFDRDAERVTRRIDGHVTETWGHADFDSIEVAKPVLFRNKGAYIVGRIRRGGRVIPLTLALVSDESGIEVDAVLLVETSVSKVFSFTRSYFFVDAVRPIELIGFLRSIMTVKPIEELYIALGYPKHGKTVRYRQLQRHLRFSTDRFTTAPGVKGMVMICFTLPSYPLVFKIIRDKFAFPKRVSRRDVEANYKLIFESDRVGRLIDAQSFEHLSFDRDRFDGPILEELATEAQGSVTIEENRVVLRHVYTERRVVPLDIYVQQASTDKALHAVVEYGNAIKDLAAANIFAGDLLVKNFGVTRQGRVVFYDYDEVCPLTKCRFRRLPTGHDGFSSAAGEVGFFVGDDDIFPEEFRSFLWPAGPLREKFLETHPELFTVEWWKKLQSQVARGDVLDFFPYDESERLPR